MSMNEHAVAARMYLEELCSRLERGRRLVRGRRDWWAGFAAVPVVVGATALSCTATKPTPANPGSLQDRCHTEPGDNVSCRDPDCAQLCQGAEYAAPAPLQARESKCTDGMDNDGDAKADCADPDCATMCSVPAYAAPPPVVPRETNCSNGLDDDGDGLTDRADPDCIPALYPAPMYAAPM